MNLIIRPPNLEILAAQGIPRDFADVRDYFNHALEKNLLPYIPRKTPITDDEILSRWIPNIYKNICFVSENLEQQRVVGCITYFEEPLSSNYENVSQRRKGEIVGTANPEYDIKLISRRMNVEMIQELRRQVKTGFLRVAIESPTIKAMQELGYNGNLVENIQHYKEAGLSGQAKEYTLP